MPQLREVLTNPQHSKRLATHMWRHFQEDRCLHEAASLSYTSLLALVPLLAVMFGIVAAFPVFEEWADGLQAFILDNMVPASRDQLAIYLEQFLGGVSRLTLTGTFFLIITALLLMMRIEASFNQIWRVPVARGLVNKITMYWAVLTLGPMALGAATALSAQPLLEFAGAVNADSGMFRSVGIFLLTWAAFWLMFVLVPNCRVPVSYAASGAFVSTVLFSLAKVAFVAYVSRASYNVIYGALAGIPIFLFWVYLVWVVILLGASLAASLTTFRDRSVNWTWPKEWELLAVYRLLHHLYRAQREGRALTTEELAELEPGLEGSRLQTLLTELHQQRLVTEDETGWLLKRDLGKVTLMDLYRSGRYHLPIGEEHPVAAGKDCLFMEVINAERLDLEQSLESLYEQRESTV